MNCAAVQQLLARLAGGEAAEREAFPEEAARHIASCPHCLEELALVETVATGEASRLLEEAFRQDGCSLAAQLLPEWAAMAAGSQDPALRHPVAWRHVQGCDRCCGELAELRELVTLAEAGKLGPLPTGPLGSPTVAAVTVNGPGAPAVHAPESAWNTLPAGRLDAAARSAENPAARPFASNPLAARFVPEEPPALQTLKRLATSQEAALPLAQPISGKQRGQ